MVHRTCKFNPRACAGSLRHSPLISLALTGTREQKTQSQHSGVKGAGLDAHV